MSVQFLFPPPIVSPVRTPSINKNASEWISTGKCMFRATNSRLCTQSHRAMVNDVNVLLNSSSGRLLGTVPQMSISSWRDVSSRLFHNRFHDNSRGLLMERQFIKTFFERACWTCKTATVFFFFPKIFQPCVETVVREGGV